LGQAKRRAKRRGGLWLWSTTYATVMMVIGVGLPLQAQSEVRTGVCATGTSSGLAGFQRPYDYGLLNTEAAVSVRGQVVDLDRRPVSAALRLLRGVRDSMPIRFVRNNPVTGEFALDSVPFAGNYILEVIAPPYLRQWHQLAPLPNGIDSLCVRLRVPAMQPIPPVGVPHQPQ
jgi:hypothetical protein